MQPWHHRPVVCLSGQGRCDQQRHLIAEAPVRICWLEKGAPSSVELLATPGQEAELACGWALSLGLLNHDDPPFFPELDAPRRVVTLPISVERSPSFGPRAAGGGCLGPTTAPPPCRPFSFDTARAVALTQQMKDHQRLFDSTGASHAAAIFDADAGLLSMAEDVGRHNAFDKAVGRLWIAGELSRAVAVALSGRVSLEMVYKAARARLGLLVAVSAPTSQAADKAEQLEMTLLGFARGEGATLYTKNRHLVDQLEQHRPCGT